MIGKINPFVQEERPGTYYKPEEILALVFFLVLECSQKWYIGRMNKGERYSRTLNAP